MADTKLEMVTDSLPPLLRNASDMRVCNRCRQETEEMFCPSCRVLTSIPRERREPATSVAGEVFECTVWQAPNRSRGIEVTTHQRDKFFSRDTDMVVLHIEGVRTIAKLGPAFWKKPAVIKKAVGEDGREKLAKFIEKHHLLPPDQSLKEKGIVDTVVFEVAIPSEEFKISVAERAEGESPLD